eukprot:scaffold3.g6621.t1
MPLRSEAAEVLLEMEAVPELADFCRLFQLYLAVKLAWDPKNRDATLRANLPHLAGREISVHMAMARSGGGERTYDFVAVRGPGTEVWIGAVLLVFTYTLPGKSTAAPLKAACVRWVTTTRHTGKSAATRLRRMHWEYASHPVLKRQVPCCDVVEAGSLLGRMLVLPDPTEDGCLFNQHLVLCESSAHQS